MKRLNRLRAALDEAKQRVSECEEAIKRCEEQISRGGDVEAIQRLIEAYRFGVTDGREAVALWAELLAKEEASIR